MISNNKQGCKNGINNIKNNNNNKNKTQQQQQIQKQKLQQPQNTNNKNTTFLGCDSLEINLVSPHLFP